MTSLKTYLVSSSEMLHALKTEQVTMYLLFLANFTKGIDKNLTLLLQALNQENSCSNENETH